MKVSLLLGNHVVGHKHETLVPTTSFVIGATTTQG